VKVPNSLIGAAGEYLVAAELSSRGWLATVTIKNAPGTDVLAQHLDSGTVVSIQTKTTAGLGSFVVGAKDESPSKGDHEWYVLVVLDAPITHRPSFYVVPRDHIACLLWVGHRQWLKKTSKAGAPHRDNPMRNVDPRSVARYKDGWDALLAPTPAVGWDMPDWVANGASDPSIGWAADLRAGAIRFV
jgi:hypothetical protein